MLARLDAYDDYRRRQPAGCCNLQGPGGAQVAYHLYADAARTQSIGVGQAVSIPVSGTTSLPIYGALTLPGGAMPAGTYTDVAQVTLSY